jgi:hypothetical protein
LSITTSFSIASVSLLRPQSDTPAGNRYASRFSGLWIAQSGIHQTWLDVVFAARTCGCMIVGKTIIRIRAASLKLSLCHHCFRVRRRDACAWDPSWHINID